MNNNSLNWTFDTVADTYEKLRPGYVDELYQTIFDYAPINNTSRVVEIGIGGGQATLPFLETGCNLIAVDYGKNFCELCREKFKGYPNFSAVSGKFEDVELNGEYDLIYSASAFHWIPEEIGYKKVFDMLKNGGVFARFANHPYRDKDKPTLSEEMDRIYAEYYYKYHNKKQEPLVEYSETQAWNRALIAEKYGFTDTQYKLFYRTRTFSAKEYIMLLGTYSDHIVIEEKIRNEFFSKIEDAINRHGGEITIYDTIDLQLARKV
ncbi:MAG: class I SAM-dependent methyltransferase [Clostridia bacterium]|nr:class I SAM-dependent methyltransferase [Clostridia bacterium]